VQLLLVGSLEFDQAYVDQLRHLIHESAIESRVLMAGFRSDVSHLLQGADLFIHTAARDPHPRAVLEAMAAGLPVVAFAVDGVAETVISGETGELVPAGDVAGLAAAAGRILRDAELALQLGAEGCARVQRDFSAEQTARGVGSIIEATLSRRRAPHKVYHSTPGSSSV
jgi:glycosyltransferase involved in cell wall biosynthesis